MIFVAESSQKRRPTVGLTPLIDVVFILLIFFMLVVNFSPLQQMPLSNIVTNAQALTLKEQPHVVRVLGNGWCNANEVEATCADIAKALGNAGGQGVYLTYKEEALLAEIIVAQDLLQAQGARVTLAIPEEEAVR